MTTPNQQAAPDGAYTIGGGSWRFGQDFDESLITNMWDIPHPSKTDLKTPFALGGVLNNNMRDVIGRALGALPFEALKKFEPWVLEEPDALHPDRPTEFTDENDAIERILSAFRRRPLLDIIDGINNGGGGGSTEPGEKIKDFLDTVKENVETLNGIAAPGNHLLSPNFEAEVIKRLPYGGGTVEYTTEESKLTQKSLKLTKNDTVEQGVYFAPNQRQTWLYAFPEHTYTAGCFVKGKSTNSNTGSVRLVLRWLDKNNAIISETAATVAQSAIKADWYELEVRGDAPANTARLEVYLASNAASPVGTVVYVDAGQVREYTFVQKVVDNIHEAIDGAVAQRQQRIETVKTKLQDAWGRFVDGLKGHTKGTTAAAVADDVYVAAAEVKMVSETADLNAGLAQAAAEEVQQAVEVQAKDYSNIAAGSDFSTWNGGNCIHPWLDVGVGRWQVSSAAIGLLTVADPGHVNYPWLLYPGHNEQGVDFGGCLLARAGTVAETITLKTSPSVQAGEQFYVEYWAMRDPFFNGTNALTRLRVGYNDDDIFLDSVPCGASIFTETNVWVKFSKTITVPVGATKLNFSFQANHNVTNSSTISNYYWRNNQFNDLPPGMGGALWIDDIIIRRLVPPEGVELLPQDKVNDLQVNMAALAAYQGANLIPNGDFEDSSYTNLFIDPNGPPIDYGPGPNATYDTSEKRSGTQSVKMVAAGLSWGRVAVPMDPLGRGPQFITCAGDGTDVFKVECWVKGSASNTYPAWGGGVSLAMWPKEGNVLDESTFGNDYIGSVQLAASVTTASNGTWTKLYAIFSPPVGVTGFYLAVAGQGDTSNVWWVDDFSCYRISEAAAAAFDAGNAASAASTAHDRLDDANTALFGSTTTPGPSASIQASAVPNLPAAKITSGTLATTVVPNLPASKITSGTLSTSVLPTALTAVGSGFLLRDTSGTMNVSCTANTVTGNMLKTADYDSTPSNTGDYTVSTGSSSELKVTASNAGWYMVEVAFGIKQQTRAVGYRIAPALYLNGSLHKIGSTVDYDGSFNARIPFSAQASFIIYLTAGDYVTPGAVLNSQSTISGQDIIGTNSGADTYFSVSLLNRSLA